MSFSRTSSSAQTIVLLAANWRPALGVGRSGLRTDRQMDRETRRRRHDTYTQPHLRDDAVARALVRQREEELGQVRVGPLRAEVRREEPVRRVALGVERVVVRVEGPRVLSRSTAARDNVHIGLDVGPEGREQRLLDEPFAALDPRWTAVLSDHLRARAAAGSTVLVSIHDLGLVGQLADRVLLLADARVAAHGPVESVLVDSVLESAYGIGFEVLRSGNGGPIPVSVRR